MRQFIAFIRKEFFHIFRDVRTLTILFGMPVAQIMLFGFAITNEIRDAKIAILDLSKDEITRDITQRILASGYFLLDANLQSFDQIEEEFKCGKVKQVIVFENDFSGKLTKEKKATVQLIADASDPNTGNTLVNYTTGIIADYQRELNENIAVPMVIEPETRMRYNPEMKGVFLFVPGLITIILMLVSALMTSISITREKELGTMELLLASPMKSIQVIIAKVVPYLTLSFINAIIIILLGYFVFGVPVKGSVALLLAESILFIFVALSLGIFISSNTNSQQTALMLSLMGLMLPTILLSGFIFPIENMPKILQIISNIIPAKWFIRIVRAIMLKGSGLELIWKETLILMLFIIVLNAISIKRFKIRLE